MKFLRYLITLLILITPAIVMAMPTQYGDSGLISVPTTEITGRGVFESAVWLNYSQNKENRFTLLPMSLSMGLGNGVELSGSYPNVLLNSRIEGSLRGFENVGIKYRTSGVTSSAFKTAVSLFLRQTVAKDGAPGLRDMGSRLMLSYRMANAEMNLNVGYLKVEPSPVTDFDNEILFGGSLDFPIFERVKPFIEVDGNTVRTGGPPRVEIAPGMAYYLLSNLTMISGVGVGLTDAGPDYRVMVGLTFSSGAGRYIKAIPVIPGSRERFAEASVTPEELMPEIDILPKEGGTEGGTPLAPLPGLEGVEGAATQPFSDGTSVPVTKPGSKEVITPGFLMGQEEIAPVPLEPPMPVLMAMPGEKAMAKIDKASLKPEIPAEVPAVVFAPPMPVSTKTGAPTQKAEDKENGKPVETIEPQSVDKGVPSAVSKPVQKAAGMAKPEIPAEVPTVTFAPPMPVTVAKAGAAAAQAPEVKEEIMPSGAIESVKPDIGKEPSPVQKTAGIEKAPSKPDVPAETPAPTFAPPMPVSVAKAGAAVTEPPASKPEIPVAAAVAVVPPVVVKKTETAAPAPVAKQPEVAETAPVEKTPLKAEIPAVAEKAETLASPVVPAAIASVAVTEIAVTKAAPPIKKKVETTPTEHRVILQGDILFAFNKWEVAPLGGKALDIIIKEIQDGKGTVVAVKLEGHTDSIGSAGYNKRLSYKRAESVKVYLIRNGIKSDIVSVEGLGKDRPVASNNTPEGRDKNRRVEIIISYMQLINQGQ